MKTFANYDCNAAGIAENDPQAFAQGDAAGVPRPKGTEGPLEDFQGLSVVLTHGVSRETPRNRRFPRGSGSITGFGTFGNYDCNSANQFHS